MAPDTPLHPRIQNFLKFTDHYPTQQTADNIILLVYCHTYSIIECTQ